MDGKPPVVTREIKEQQLGRRKPHTVWGKVKRGSRLLAAPVLNFTWAKWAAGFDSVIEYPSDVPEEMLAAAHQGFGLYPTDVDVRCCDWE